MNTEVKSKKDLYRELYKVLDKEINNAELIRSINKEYSKKGLDLRTVTCLFQGVKELESLSDIELIALTIGVYNCLKWKKFRLEENFSDTKIMEYDSFIQHKDFINTIEIDNCLKIDDFNYLCYLTHRQIYEYYTNNLILYNKSTQRAGKYARLGNLTIRKIDLNLKSVEEISKLMESGEFEEDLGILGISLFEDKTPLFEFVPSINKTIGKIKYKPILDRESDNYSFCAILDSFHRITGSLRYTSKHLLEHGTYPETGGLPFKIVLRSIEDSKRIVRQIFKRSDTNISYLKSLEKNDYTDFIDGLVNNSNILKGRTASDYGEYRAYRKKYLTYKTILVQALENTDLQVNNKARMTFIYKRCAEIIDICIEYLAEEYFANNLEEMRSVTSLLSANSFVVWLYIALYISQRKNFDDYITLANEIFLDSNVWQEFGLEKKSIVFSEIKKYVEEKFAKEES